MKTKIIYISGDEIFNINDIRAAFEEVRNALQLSKDTVLFGVPVDKDDAELNTNVDQCKPESVQTIANEIIDEEIIDTNVAVTENPEPVIINDEEKPKPKRGRARKNIEIENDDSKEQPETIDELEKIVPISSILSVQDDETLDISETETTDNINPEPESEIVTENVQINIVNENETKQDITSEIDNSDEIEEESNSEPDLEKLLSIMTPLQEDISESENSQIDDAIPVPDIEQTEDVDATLEQLATEFAETQDKIAAETKASNRSKIGKLRNILPFKPSKQKDQGLGDLFYWAGMAANDEEFSVPGFFTNTKSKK